MCVNRTMTRKCLCGGRDTQGHNPINNTLSPAHTPTHNSPVIVDVVCFQVSKTVLLSRGLAENYRTCHKIKHLNGLSTLSTKTCTVHLLYSTTFCAALTHFLTTPAPRSGQAGVVVPGPQPAGLCARPSPPPPRQPQWPRPAPEPLELQLRPQATRHGDNQHVIY